MMSLKILHVIQSLAPEIGGPPFMCAELAKAQQSLGHSVEIGVESFDPNRTVLKSEGGVLVRVLGKPDAWERLIPGTYTKSVEKVCLDKHIVHIHGVWDTVLVASALAATRVNVPHVVVPHGMIDPWCLRQKWWKKKIGLAIGTRRMLQTAAAMHFIYPEELSHARMIDVNTIGRVIPNGVSLADIDPTPDPAEFRGSISGLGRDPFILFLGRLHQKKGLDILADAFARIASRFPALRLVVAGPDQGACEPFVRQVSATNLLSRVHVVGPLYGRRKLSALAAATCFCLPSRQEGFSVAILESLACRTPVVITDACHFPQVAQSDAGIVVPLAASAVGDALAELVSDSIGSRAKGERGRRLVEEMYTWEKVAAQTIDLYHSVLMQASISK